MGSISTSKQKTTTNSTQKENATTAPVIEDWVRKDVRGWADQVGQFGKSDPYSFVAGPSALQQQAFAGAQNLGGWQAGNQAAQNMAMSAAGAPANLASATGYNPTLTRAFGYDAPTIADTAIGSAVGATLPTLGPAAQATSQGYNPLSMTAAQAEARGYNPIFNSNVAQASGQGYDAAQAAASLVGPAAQAQAVLAGPAAQAAAERAAYTSMLEGGMDRYLAPTTGALVDSTLADFDVDAGRTRAAQSAAGARNRAFGGSRFALQEAATEGELARARATTAAQLRDRAFTQAVGMAQFDTGNRQSVNNLNAQLGTQVSQYNTGETNQNARLNAQLGTQTAQFNTGESNQNSRLNAQLGTQVSTANAGFTNDSRAAAAAAANAAALANAGFTNQNNWRNQDAGNREAEFRAAADNTRSITNAGLMQQASAANMEAGNRAAEFGQAAANQRELANAGFNNQFTLAGFGAQTDAAAQLAASQNQYGLADYQGRLQTAMTGAEMQARAREFAASAAGQAASQNAGFQNRAAEFGAASTADTSRFNAQQGEAALARQLQGAGLLGELANAGANNQRADLNMTAQLGAQQQALEQMRVSAPLQYMQIMSELQRGIPYQMFSGQNVVGNTNSSGTNVGISKPSIFSMIMQAGEKAAQAYAAGSDRRLKRDIERIGEHEGLGLYEFNYNWDDADQPKRTGVMADEVEKLRPDALGPLIAGEYKTVFYHKLGLGHLMAGMN